MTTGRSHDVRPKKRDGIACIPLVSSSAMRAKLRMRALLRSSAFLFWSISLIGIGFLGSVWFSEGNSVPPTVIVEGKTEAHASLPLSYGEQPLLSIESFFISVREGFLAQKVSFVEVNLASMILSVYSDGVKTLEVPIQTKGREGSWWETPSGVYAIQSKERTHFSTFGQVNQPWSMAFQGNFFIHGWPQYPDGTPVASSYSGGCVRLTDEDAERVYQAVAIGMPVLVHEQDYVNDSFSYAQAPVVSASSYLVADLQSGAVLAERDSKGERSVASITKLITALVAVEHINLDKTITITDVMRASTSIPRLKSGAHVSAYALLFPLLKESSNEAAEALARSMGRELFITRMNDKARAIGMEHSVFADVSGALATNVSTADDLFHLARYLLNNRSFLLRITADGSVPSAYAEPIFVDLQNFNVIPGTEGFIGGKVGKTTAAGETGMYLFRVAALGEERTLAVVVLGSTDRVADARALLSFVQERYGVILSTEADLKTE